MFSVYAVLVEKVQETEKLGFSSFLIIHAQLNLETIAWHLGVRTSILMYSRKYIDGAW